MTDEINEKQGQIVKGLFNQVKQRIHWKQFLDEWLYNHCAEYQIEDEKSESSLLNVALLPWEKTICFSKDLLYKIISKTVLWGKIKEPPMKHITSLM